MNRELERSDLPKTRSSGKSLHLPVINKRGVKKYVCDIHFADEALCYLEGANGKPTKINTLLIEDKTLRKEFEEETKDQLYYWFQEYSGASMEKHGFTEEYVEWLEAKVKKLSLHLVSKTK